MSERQSPLPRPNTAMRLLITGLKGGVGKTVTATNLGAELARQGWRVLIVDIDPVGGSTFLITNQKASSYDATITTVLTGYSRGEHPQRLFEDALVRTNDPRTPMKSEYQRLAWSGIHLLPANGDAAWLQFPAARLRDLDAVVSQVATEYGYDAVLFDAGASANPLTVAGLYAARRVLAVEEASALSMHALDQLFDSFRQVRRHHPDLDFAGVVPNKVGRKKEHARRLENYSRDLGDLLSPVRIPDYTLIEQAEGAHLPVRAMGGRLAHYLADRYLDLYTRTIDQGRNP